MLNSRILAYLVTLTHKQQQQQTIALVVCIKRFKATAAALNAYDIYACRHGKTWQYVCSL